MQTDPTESTLKMLLVFLDDAISFKFQMLIGADDNEAHLGGLALHCMVWRTPWECFSAFILFMDDLSVQNMS